MTLRSRLRRFLRFVVLVPVSAYALYLIAMNVFVRTRLFRNLISEDPGSMLVDYTNAYSLVPGRIHVEGLSIRGRDSHVEWILTLDRCDFRVAFAAFFHRRFHADHVHGDGLTLRVRQREPAFTPDEAAALPPVPGFSDPPFAGPPPAPLTDANYNLWSIWLEGVVADHVREIWIDTVRYTGDFQVRGRWFFRPVRWLDVGPATVTAHTLTVSRGLHETWVEGAMGQVVVTVHPFDVRAVERGAILHQVSMAGDLRATVDVAEVANHELAGGPVHVESGTAEIDTHVAIDHGVLRPGTTVGVAPFAARARALGLELAATLASRARVDAAAVGHLAVELGAVRVAQGTFPRARAEAIAGTLRSADLDLLHPFSDASYTVDARGLATGSLRYWHARLPLAPRLLLDSGEVAVDGHFEGSLPRRDAAGHLDVRVSALRIGGDGAHVGGDLTAAVHVVASLREQKYDLSGTELTFDDVHGEAGGLQASVPRVQVHALRLVLAKAGVLGRVTLDLPSIEVPSIAPLSRLLHLPRGIVIGRGLARGEAHLAVDLGAGTASGEAQLFVPTLRVRLGPQTLTGKLRVVLRAKQDGARTDVSGTSLQFHTDPGDGWWARMDLPRAELTARAGGRLDAHVELFARDASPLTALLSDEGNLATKLAVAVVPTSGLHVSGDVIATPSVFEARSFEARADGFDLDAELAQLGRERIGAAVVVVGAVRAGVDLGDDPEGAKLFGADSWFVARRAALRARERAYE